MDEAVPFRDRTDAGEQLADALAPLALESPILLALPRGGVPVAAPIARRLGAPLDVLLVRKIGMPGNPEVALGAVVDGQPPQWVVNEWLMAHARLPEDWFDAEMRRQLDELKRRRQRYCGDRPAPSLAGRDVIVVDDGIATGATVRAGLKALAATDLRKLLLAVPVGPAEVIDELSRAVDELVCLARPERFVGVGLHYRDFSQTDDEEVIRLLGQYGAQATGAGGG
ncbi:phosphoribosyltransferase [Stutzerimonas urumqiensis]|uniref:phosphoribosyltransferase n=1 Tax=Stutzerimonas urumqiensis TaxID=638269 RepID=UPI003BA9CF7A